MDTEKRRIEEAQIGGRLLKDYIIWTERRRIENR